MRKCDDCIYRNEPEYNKPCVVYREDCPLYEKEGEEMTNKEAIEELKAIKSEYSNKAFGDSRLMRSEIEALDVAVKALENISHITDRPCDVCEFHGENGCTQWKCVFCDELFGGIRK